MSEKTSFVMYTRYAQPFELLSGGELKQLMAAIFAYVDSGKTPNFTDNSGLKMAFTVVKADLDRDSAKWEESKVKASEAGKKGAEKRWGKSGA